MNSQPSDFAVHELSEWRPRFIPGAELTGADQELRDQLAEGGEETRLTVEEVRGGLLIRPTAWIGVVRFERLELRVVPKLVGGNLGVLRMINYSSGLGSLKRLPRGFDLSTGEHNLIDLVCLLLSDQADMVVSAGLLQGYVQKEEALAVLRGRLLPLEQARKRFMMLDRLECRFEDFETDITDNRLVGAGLAAARRVCIDEQIRRRVRLMHAVFAEACQPEELDTNAIETLEYDRRNDNYRSAHMWSKLLLQRTALKDVFEHGEGRSFAFLLNMNQLFEDFVTQLVRDSFLDAEKISVNAQHRDASIIEDERTGRPYAAVIPDLLIQMIESDGLRRIPIDAKYKLYDEKKLDSADVYQTFMYSYAFGRADQSPIAILIYPSVVDSTGTILRVRVGTSTRPSRIVAMSLNVPDLLAAIASDVPASELGLKTRLADAWRPPPTGAIGGLAALGPGVLGLNQ